MASRHPFLAFHRLAHSLEGDVEHCLNIQEADDLIGALVNGVEILKKIIIAENNALLIEKSTPAPIEGNPLRGPNNIEGKQYGMV